MPADGGSTTPQPASPPGHFHPFGWLGGGEIIVAQLGRPTVTDIVSFTPDPKAEVKPVVQTDASEGNGGLAVSPDGKWLAYVSDVTGRGEVWVRPYPGPGAPIRVSSNGGIEPQWSRSGRELYFIEDRETMMMAAVDAGPQLTFTPPVGLFRAPFIQGGQPPTYDVAPDGRFLIVRPTADQGATNLVVAINWFEELRQRVPVN